MENKTTYGMLGEVFTLAPPTENAVEQDLLQRIYAQLCQQISPLATPGPSIDWRLAAGDARDEVAKLRSQLRRAGGLTLTSTVGSTCTAA